ncbi:MAG: PAS domain-containing protein [Tatlockia sp.]|nr:PAS domain-containing protein [Tatlockia sp.]
MKSFNQKLFSITFDDLNALLKTAQLNLWIWDLVANQSKDFGCSSPLFSFTGIDYFLEKIHPEDRKDIASQLRKSLEIFVDFKIEFRIKIEDKTDYDWVQATGHFISDNDKNFVKIIGTWRNLTEKKFVQEIIQLQQNLIKNLLQINTGKTEGNNTIDKNKLLTASEIQALERLWKNT